jgi:hypothetical protein
MNKVKEKPMKKIVILLFLILFSVQFGNAALFTLGFNAGYRYLKDPILEEIYGDGYVFEPYFRYTLPRYVTLELAYEGGYKRSGTVGLFQENSTLTVTGFQLAGIVPIPIFRIPRLTTYFKFGVAYYFYKQEIDSEFVRQQVDHTKWTTVIGGGLNIRLSKGLSMSVEVKSVPLRVRPFDINVDLGGIRILLGIGYQFWL